MSSPSFTQDNIDVIMNEIVNFDMELIKWTISFSFNMGIFFGLLKYLIYHEASKDCFIFGFLSCLFTIGLNYLLYLNNNRINNISDIDIKSRIRLKTNNFLVGLTTLPTGWIIILIIYLSL